MLSKMIKLSVNLLCTLYQLQLRACCWLEPDFVNIEKKKAHDSAVVFLVSKLKLICSHALCTNSISAKFRYDRKKTYPLPRVSVDLFEYQSFCSQKPYEKLLSAQKGIIIIIDDTVKWLRIIIRTTPFYQKLSAR